MSVSTVAPPSSGTVTTPKNKPTEIFPAQPSHQGQTEQNPIVAAWQWLFPDSTSFFTFMLVASTILLWRATMRIAKDSRESGKTQADKMERSIAEAAKAATAMQGIADATQANSDKFVESVEHQRVYGNKQLRAYVMAKDHAVGVLVQGKRPVFVCKLHNSGFTPAHEVRCTSAIFRTIGDPSAEPIMFRKIGREGTTSSTMIGRDDFYIHPYIYREINQSELNLIHEGKVALIFAGIISYRDVFGRRHLSTWKTFLQMSGPPEPETKLFELMSASKGNEGN